MIEHTIQKAICTYLGTLGTGWTAYHDHSSTAKSMPRFVVSTGPTEQRLRVRTLDASIRAEWLPDDTTDDTAHDKVELVRYALESEKTVVAALNAILNLKGIDILWAATTGIQLAEGGERERSVEITYRLQYFTGA